MQPYPRVLIVYMSCLNKADQHGVSLRNWFAEWPRENLGQIYSGGEVGNERFCGQTFKLGPSERRFGPLFYRLKHSSLGENSTPKTLNEHFSGKLDRISHRALLQAQLSRVLTRSGLWEIIFSPVLSPRLLKWVTNFAPQMIYCQGYDLSFVWLPLMLKRALSVPLCFQTGDDWPFSLYSDSIISWAMRPIVVHAVKQLIASSSMRLANGDLMASEYSIRYKADFRPIMMSDDLDRFRNAIPIRVTDKKKISIIYTGGLAHNRWESLVSLCEAANLLRPEGHDIAITAFVPSVPYEAVNAFSQMSNLEIKPPLPHEQVPAVLKGADILFLPETFDPIKVAEIRLSISTKAHLYMMSERPILVCGSPLAGVVEYANREHWAFVVSESGINSLVDGLRQLIVNNDMRQSLIDTGIAVALKNHNSPTVRKRFLANFQEILDCNAMRL